MITVGAAEVECPEDVVDRMLWVDAQHILRRHVSNSYDNMCVWCGREWPCPPRRLAERAELASYQPWREAVRWSELNENSVSGLRSQPAPRPAAPLLESASRRSQRNGRTYGRPRTPD
jgi:hypothetical protein